MRKGFSLITAIFVMVLMATLALLVFNMSSKLTSTTTSQYQREQALLLAKSYTELAIMSVINHDRNTTGNCIETINGEINGLTPGQPLANGLRAREGIGYSVQTRISYIGQGLPCANARKLNDSNLNNATRSQRALITNYNNLGASDSIAAILVDVYVRYKDLQAVDLVLQSGAANAATVPWQTYHRRTLQKI